MKTVVLAIVLSATVAFGAAAYYFNADDTPAISTGSPETNTFDPSLPVEARIDALEKAVSDERLARQLLQDEVFYLTNELERLSIPERFEEPVSRTAETVSEEQPAMSRDERRRRARSREGRMERLVEAGFLPSQAEQITQREQELQMQAIQERFDAERSGEDVDWMANRSMTSFAGSPRQSG